MWIWFIVRRKSWPWARQTSSRDVTRRKYPSGLIRRGTSPLTLECKRNPCVATFLQQRDWRRRVSEAQVSRVWAWEREREKNWRMGNTLFFFFLRRGKNGVDEDRETGWWWGMILLPSRISWFFFGVVI